MIRSRTRYQSPPIRGSTDAVVVRGLVRAAMGPPSGKKATSVLVVVEER